MDPDLATTTRLPKPGEVQGQVRRILESRMFAGSKRLCRFISFAAQHALSGTGEPLKEYVIGVEVFDRTSVYDPRIDPIVRVEARRLRAKLNCYYSSVGREDPVEVEFPKGTYQPVFRLRTPRPEVAGHAMPNLALAVLPFAPLTAGLDNGFAAGLTEEIVHGLTKHGNLRLMPWNSPDHSNELPVLKNRQKIDVLLRGSVRCQSTGIRVISQLIDVTSQAYLWSEAYDRQDRDFLEAQDGIAQAIIAKVIALTAECGA